VIVTMTVVGLPPMTVVLVDVTVSCVGDVCRIVVGVADTLGTPWQAIQVRISDIWQRVRTKADLHPIPWHTKPGMQQPPPKAAAQLVASAGHCPTPPPHVDPLGQQATWPTSVSGTSVQ
jgi:hypothetical protein